MARTGFLVPKNLFEEDLDEFTYEELGHIFKAMILISNEEKPIDLTHLEKRVVKEWVKFDTTASKRYMACVENGAKGGRPKDNQTETKEKPKENQTETKTKPKDKPDRREEEEEKEEEKDISKDMNNKRFKRPTVEEVRAYCVERKNGINAETFVAFYDSKGWLVGKSPMKDWRACVRTWEQNNYGKPKTIRKPMLSDISERDNDWSKISKSIPDPLEDIV